MAAFTAEDVISLKVTLFTSTFSTSFFALKSLSKCHAMASPSLSGSVAR